MRALRFDGHHITLDRATPAPKPAPGEALVRPTLTGISAADTAPAYRGILGHEFVGIVEDVNIPLKAPASLAEKKSLKGKRVVGSINIVCGLCDLCRRGLSNHCRARTILGVSGRDGVFADRFTIPLVNLYPVPDSVDDDHAVFAEPLAAALHAAQVFRVEGKPYITVIGDGKLGLLTVQVMARLNASVRLLGRNPTNLALCDKWGIKHRHTDEVGRRQDQDVVVDCTGTDSGLALAMSLVRPRGKIILTTPCHRPAVPPPVGEPATPALDLSPIVQHEIELIGSRCGSIEAALAALAKREIHVAPLISRRGPLDDAPALIHAAAAQDAIKVLITHNRAA